jgi:bifunctional non-homologous end joining protein LigD
MSTRTSSTLKVGNRTLQVSNLDKVLYPAVGFTKGQVIDYYIRIAPVLLPHLKDRALTLKRYPNGVTGEYFYEKRCPSHRPDWVRTAPIWSEGNNDYVEFCLANDLPTPKRGTKSARQCLSLIWTRVRRPASWNARKWRSG